MLKKISKFSKRTSRIPRKSPKYKIKSPYKVKLDSSYPLTPYEYSISVLKILPNKRTQGYQLIQPLRKTLIYLFNKGRITYHEPDYISTNIEFLKRYFETHKEPLRIIQHPAFNRLSTIYYKIKLLVVK